MAYLWPCRPVDRSRRIASSAMSLVTSPHGVTIGAPYPRPRSSPFTTLPLALRGSSVTNSTALGTL